MNTQFIQSENGSKMAVIPEQQYRVLLEKAEMLDDVAAYDAAKLADEELIPARVVNELMDGVNPVKVWRKYRGLTQVALADSVGVKQSAIAQLETGSRDGQSIGFYKNLARVLDVDLDDLV